MITCEAKIALSANLTIPMALQYIQSVKCCSSPIIGSNMKSPYGQGYTGEFQLI